MEDLLQGVEYRILQKSSEGSEYTGIEYDSRKIKKGDIFIALEGAIVDGHKYIKQAVENGAKAVIVSKEVELEFPIDYILVKDLRKNLGIIASNFYNYPQNRLKIIGITGTNGKTTSTYLLESILGEDRVARIGTVEYKIGDEIIEAPNTTPESLDIVKMCKKAVDKGLEYLVMEVSSHALSLGRVDMLKFDVASFTNLTLDHLDYHKNMQNYFEAKRKLFTMTKCKDSTAINIDDPYGERLYEEFGGYSYSLNREADLMGEILEFHSDGQLIRLKIGKESYEIKLAILGRYNLYNVLGVIGIALKLGVDVKSILKRLEILKGAPGRFELVNCGQDYIVVVDYAHTGDALENILNSINELKKGRVITVFGCGGDRDSTKRPIMGKIAQDLSDIAILTSDNPRTEDPHKIIEDVLKGMDGNNYIVKEDRECAIVEAIKIAQKNDIILIAGKGHETYQILGRKKIHFDDREIARREIVKKKIGG
ncbi:UDP-N-acetylmuramoyl-L-alanyl-D-glutamate--2,6-diaminopimelate ligase [Fusobacterium sp.]|uniref:UDP-N-acetylmuramoyl-L-alanyl-D-glutamate--2, 6-diaminopimelate ligase n=1 Tax=Fusobacterium sp. TaxID=68766 RepID=UPI00260415B5|nr:UDP-N-acetylmuramoyl-L-alanyl-D-glutamate--2,6-diaminopimelate ligase [Fusobacterium sp.]